LYWYHNGSQHRPEHPPPIYGVVLVLLPSEIDTDHKPFRLGGKKVEELDSSAGISGWREPTAKPVLMQIETPHAGDKFSCARVSRTMS